MKKMKKIKKMSLKAKVLLSLAIIAAGSFTTLGSMFIYAHHSDERNGALSPADKTKFSNNFSLIYNQNNQLEPQVSILDPLKSKNVASFNLEKNTYKFNNDTKEYSFNEFFNKYFDIYNESFVLEVKYGSFSFFDEYVLAVQPKQFIEFSKWFIENVAWGPDLITLESFRIVPGVEQNGNAVTLGSHSTLHKESSEIKFFPDAFFGSMPLFSTLSGPNNAPDSFATRTFADLQSKDVVDSYLKNIPFSSAIKNFVAASENGRRLHSYFSISMPGKLIGKEFYVYSNPKGTLKTQGFNLILNTDLNEQKLEELKKDLDQELQNLTINDFKKMTLVSALNSTSGVEQIRFNFEYTNEQGQKAREFIILNEDNLAKASIISEKVLADKAKENIHNFLDLYDLDNYIGRDIIFYRDAKNNQNYFYRNRLIAANEIPNFDQADFDKLETWNIKNIENKDAILYVTLFNPKTSRSFILTYNAFDMADKEKEFSQFKSAIDYPGAIKPIAISVGAEDVLLKKENPTSDPLNFRKYQIYNEAYDGLYETVTKKFPHLLKNQFGPHVERKLNEQGFYEYSLENGPYKGMSDSDRIGFPLVLAATLDNFDGISTDFLKYVAAHEYGHHLTLEKSQALDNENNAIIVGGISVNGGISDSSYYSDIALKNYLQARTNLDYDRVNAVGDISPTGTFLRFKFKNKNGEWVTETVEDVWGSKNKDSVFDTISNPYRRFLQTFEGLKKYAEDKGIRLGDLFLANSLDHNSGTLNPFYRTEAKALYLDENNNLVFQNADEEKVVSSLRDGLNQPIPYDFRTNEDGSRNLIFRFIESENIVENPDRPNDIRLKITKINLKNEDGTPFINVPLNEVLTLDESDYVRDRIREVESMISNFITLNYYESGWNDRNTFMGGKLDVKLTNMFQEQMPQSYIDQIIQRSNPIEYNPATNSLTSERKAFRYFALKGNTVQQYVQLSQGYGDIFAQNSNASWGNPNPILTFVDSQNNIKSKFSFPRARESRFLASLEGQLNTIKTIADQYNLSAPDSTFIAYNFSASIFSSLLNPASGSILATDSKNRVLDQETLLAFAENRLNAFSKIGINLFAENLKNEAEPFYFSFNPNLIHEVEKEVTQNEQKSIEKTNTLLFDTWEDLFTFGSIDYSKATKKIVLNPISKILRPEYDWDVEYVKTKFDINKFISEYQNDKNITLDEQQAANLLMLNFRRSSFFMAVKDFNPATELVQNQAILSKEYGIDVAAGAWKSFYEDKQLFDPEDVLAFDVNDVQKIINEFIKSLSQDPRAVENLDSNDLYFLLGGFMVVRDFGKSSPVQYGDFFFSLFNDGTPSSDVINYNLSRTEPLLNDKITDYIYSIAESLTRDYVQTTFVPSDVDFKELPSYIKNVNEQNTALDYVVDGRELRIWNEKLIPQSEINEANRVGVLNSSYQQLRQRRIELINEFNLSTAELVKKSDELQARLDSLIRETEEYENVSKELEETQKEISRLRQQTLDKIETAIETIAGSLYNVDIWANSDRLQNSLFGTFAARSNGFFRDKVQKEVIGMELYDDKLNPIIDDEIRILDFEGNKVNSRPKAFFVSQLKSYGVGDRYISGLYRNKDLDAVAMYGYVPLEVANKIKYIKFVDKNTTEILYLPVNTDKTNNIFYLEKQGDINSKKTIEDFGYTSWISDYALMSKYRDTLLKPGHDYSFEFVDANKQFVADIHLGSLNTISENGKDLSTSPIKVVKDPTDQNKSIIKVDHQFNING
ncbi:PDxFFG protein [Mycoplasmopsis ciconiae]|uniref:PDxFFG protein n=1 Tax=Mycoplasmopsis ciconiae TaxID=561067 RepID=A0ABU7MM72_9BACT|nr:PDxFFG protein [Mycoplasmopsis ciconiae]